MTKHTLMIKGRKAMTFRTASDERVTYQTVNRWHYAYQGDRLVAAFIEPQGWPE
jgi:hypothetical protein